jgi:hypothetical protein
VENALFESFVVCCTRESDTIVGIINSLWAPRNACLLGKGTAKFIQEGTYKYIPYCNLFRRTEFLKWKIMVALRLILTGIHWNISVYGLDDVLTLYRGTVRGSVFQRLGICLFNWEWRTICDGGFWKYELPPFVNSFLPSPDRFRWN